MIREEAYYQLRHGNKLYLVKEVIDQIFDEHEAQLKVKDEISLERKEACELLKEVMDLQKEAYEAKLKAQDEEITRWVKMVDRLKSKLLHKKWDAIEFRHLFLSTKFSKNKKLLAKKYKRLEQ